MSVNVTPQPNAAAATLKEMRHGVAKAADFKLLQVVRALDALPDRGAADAVLAQVRHRLPGISVERPLRFSRLLFLPLDPLIVAPNIWRPNVPHVPRTSLAVLSKVVRGRIGNSNRGPLEALDAIIAGATTIQLSRVNQGGALLWPQAAIILRDVAIEQQRAGTSLSEIGADWLADGLPPASLAPLAHGISVVLANAVRLNAWEQAGEVAIGRPALTEILDAALHAHPLAWGMMIALLATRFPQTRQIFEVAASADRQLRPFAEAALDIVFGSAEIDHPDRDPPIKGGDFADVAHRAALLDALAAHVPDPRRRRRALDARTKLLNGCLRRTDVMLRAYMAVPLRNLPETTSLRGAALDELENVARTVRQYETASRSLGSPLAFEALIQGACEGVIGAPGLSRMDKARLIEVLAGTDAAMQVLANA